jgi:hypothetical protein
MVGLLDLAASGGCEVALAQRLASALDAGKLPDLEALSGEFAPRVAALPTVHVQLPSLAQYDQLMRAA